MRIGLHCMGMVSFSPGNLANISDGLAALLFITLLPIVIYILQYTGTNYGTWNLILEINNTARNLAISVYFYRILCKIENIYMACIILALLLSGDIELNPGPSPGKALSVSHINAQSMLNKLDLIAVELGCYDIITVSETWLDKSIPNSLITIPGYQEPIRLDRNRQGGGVAMYFKLNIPFTERSDLTIPNVEALWAEISLCNKKVLIGCFYVHPRFQEWNLVELSIEQALQSCPNLILLGDFNENMLDHRKCRNIKNI